MIEYMHLVGSEQVQNAANTMRHAAEEMNRASANLEGVLFRHQLFLDDWLIRYERAMELDRSERKHMTPAERIAQKLGVE